MDNINTNTNNIINTNNITNTSNITTFFQKHKITIIIICCSIFIVAIISCMICFLRNANKSKQQKVKNGQEFLSKLNLECIESADLSNYKKGNQLFLSVNSSNIRYTYSRLYEDYSDTTEQIFILYAENSNDSSARIVLFSKNQENNIHIESIASIKTARDNSNASIEDIIPISKEKLENCALFTSNGFEPFNKLLNNCSVLLKAKISNI